MDLQCIDQLRASVAGTISMLIGNTHCDIIVGKYDAFESEVPLLLHLDVVKQAFQMPPQKQAQPYTLFANFASLPTQTAAKLAPVIQ